jgi:hypothetical protein
MAPYVKPTETQFDVGGTTIGALFDVGAGTLDVLSIPGLDANEQTDPGEAYYHFLRNLNRRLQNMPADYVPDKWGVSFQQTPLNNGNVNHVFIASFERKPISGGSTQPA